MKLQTKTLLVLSWVLVFLSIVVTAQAAGNSRMLLSAKQATFKVGQETQVDILIEDAPVIYGADVQVSFDPEILEVVDADEKKAGIQISSGKFIDEKKSFFLIHSVDNNKGSIDYALTLLNPAPPVQGGGQLARITFRAKTTGSTVVSITKGKFGTQTGETISPDLANVEITVGDGKANEEGKVSILALVGLTGTGLIGTVSVSGWFWLKRTRRTERISSF